MAAPALDLELVVEGHDFSGSLRSFRRGVVRQARQILQPPSLVNVWEWADAHRVLSRDAGAVEPGRWRTDRVPYLREIMESLTDPDVERVVFMKSSQVGGTEIANNWIGYTMDADPSPMLMLHPTDEALKLWSTIKLDAMLRDCEVLQGKVVDATSRRDKRNTMRRKMFSGGSLVGISAKSSAQLRSLVAPRAVADEVDEYVPDVNRQGDPLELLERAMRTFLRVGLAKLFVISTPTDAETSRILQQYQRSDQRTYHLPCPQCNHVQPLEWQREGQYAFRFEMDDANHVAPDSTRYACRACEHLIEARWRESMLAAGTWVPAGPVRKRRGYHVWTAYSPHVTWDAITQKFLDERRTPAGLKTFVNLWLGQPFKEYGKRIEPSVLAARAVTYGDDVEVPHGVGILTAAIDVQGDRLEWLVWGWGADEESWGVGWDRVDGDPGDKQTFRSAYEAIVRPWRHASSATLFPSILLVDAGYRADDVWAFTEWCRGQGMRALPVIGKQGPGRPYIQKPVMPKYRKTREQRRPTHLVGTDAVKDELIGSRLYLSTGPRAMHFPDHFDASFYDQLTAEEKRTVYVRTRPERRWVKLRDRANEATDLLGMCFAGLHELGPRVIAQLETYATQLSQYRAPANGQAPPPPAGPKYGLLTETDW